MTNLPPNDERSPNSPLPHAELAALEAQLAALTPNGDRLNRERLIFRAGQASVMTFDVRNRRPWAWPAAFGGVTAVAASLLVALIVSGGSKNVEQQPLAGIEAEVERSPIPRTTDVPPPTDGMLTTGHSLHDLDRLLAGDLNGHLQAVDNGVSMNLPAPARVLDVRSYRELGVEL